jgi:hypothetical protein
MTLGISSAPKLTGKWTRRMRQRLLDYVAHGGNELDELPLEAVKLVVVAPAPVGQPAAPTAIAK